MWPEHLVVCLLSRPHSTILHQVFSDIVCISRTHANTLRSNTHGLIYLLLLRSAVDHFLSWQYCLSCPQLPLAVLTYFQLINKSSVYFNCHISFKEQSLPGHSRFQIQDLFLKISSGVITLKSQLSTNCHNAVHAILVIYLPKFLNTVAELILINGIFLQYWQYASNFVRTSSISDLLSPVQAALNVDNTSQASSPITVSKVATLTALFLFNSVASPCSFDFFFRSLGVMDVECWQWIATCCHIIILYMCHCTEFLS